MTDADYSRARERKPWTRRLARLVAGLATAMVLFLLWAVLLSPGGGYFSAHMTWHREHERQSPDARILRMYDGALRFFEEGQGPGERRFPASSDGVHPPIGEVCGPVRTLDWEDFQTWRELDFEERDPHLYHYQFDSSGHGNSAQFTASAFGDIDCDGVFSTFVRFGTVREGAVIGSSGMYIENELE